MSFRFSKDIDFFVSPVANTSAKASVMTRLFVDLVQDSLTEFAYDADLAGLRYDLVSTTLGLYMSLSGYNDKLHVLAKDVLERTRNLKVQPDRLAVMQDQVRVSLKAIYHLHHSSLLAGQTRI